ncbi:hypothetical protein EAF04_002088 [Stromatinia cepivora]|nr:hypothetical protein EAF04_002088 [Stromatinia cepivora]
MIEQYPIDIVSQAPSMDGHLVFQNSKAKKRPASEEPIATPAPRTLKRARLTKQNLKEWERMNRGENQSTKLNDQGYGNSKSSGSGGSKSNGSNSSSNTISTTNAAFANRAQANGILTDRGSEARPPTNHEELIVELNRTRRSASPTESMFRDYKNTIRRHNNNKHAIVQECIPLLLKADSDGYIKSYNQAQTDFPKNVGFNNGLPSAHPDVLEGLEMDMFKPFPVRDELGGAAIVRPGYDSITLAHFGGEFKSPCSSIPLANLQAAYDGASMVYGREQALSYINRPDPVGSSSISTFSCNGLLLNTFAHYVVQDPLTKKREYHQFQLDSVAMTGNFLDYKRGKMQVRNLQDRGRRKSLMLRDDLVAYSRRQYEEIFSREIAVSREEKVSHEDEENEEHDDDEDTYGPSHQLWSEMDALAKEQSCFIPQVCTTISSGESFLCGKARPISPPQSMYKSG